MPDPEQFAKPILLASCELADLNYHDFMKHIVASGLALVLTVGSSAAAELKAGGTVAFLGLTFINTSAETTHPEEEARVLLLEREIAGRFADEGLQLLDLAPIQAELDATTNPANCYGCELRMAAKIDADYVLVGVVQKVSNLIISMNLVMRDVATQEVVRARSVDVRSNTDDSWLRGMRYIMKTAFFKTT